MNRAERDRLVHHMESALEKIRAMPVTTPCAECLYFDAGRCRSWSADVPVAAQAAGCEKWEEGIPF